MRRLKHIGSVRDYVKEFSLLMLEIPNMTEEELLFNFMDNLQGGDSSKVESLEDSYAMGGGNKVSRDYNASRMGSGKTPNVREGRGVQVNEAKGERVEVACTHMDKVTKEKVNSMGKRKQHSKHRKCRCLHPSKASREKKAGKLGTCGCLEKVLEAHQEVSRRGNDGDVDDIDIRIPNNIQEALHILEWKTLIEEEIRALEKNGTWEFAKLLKEKNLVGSKWIFIVKYKADGSVGRYKARLVAKDLYGRTKLATNKPLL
ncbi:hypothetical protein CK203_060098 [Vitis vinifera]|uniref:Reverse transcriptase Ty1/copia-type domain-containing protein n=1 Tax=Vitis vinifera TaxID=29760 RepID=A0A438GGG5_VITVI|nr:hypothetical protein CK203_060098 [Vitis vinifera]